MVGPVAIAIITHRRGYEADHVIDELRRRGLEPVRLNSDDFPGRYQVSLRLGRRPPAISLRVPGGTIDADAIGVAWYQQPPVFHFDEGLAPAGRMMAERESRPFLDAIWRLAPWRWLNSPHAVDRARDKLLQLRLAARVGLRTPPTLASNDERQIRTFCERHQWDVIIKDLSLGVVTIDAGSYHSFTRLFTPEDLRDLTSLRFGPALLQRNIRKDHELRVTVVGDGVFAARIDSQASPIARIDYRRGELWSEPQRYAGTDLPPDVQDACRAITKALGLGYGAIDLIVDPAGEVYFLEVNATGAWIWIERLTGLPITAAIADRLIQMADLRSDKGAQ